MSKNFEKAEIDICKLPLSDIIVCSPDPGLMDGPILGVDEEDSW